MTAGQGDVDMSVPADLEQLGRRGVQSRAESFGDTRQHRAPAGIDAIDLASIGETGGITGRRIGSLSFGGMLVEADWVSLSRQISAGSTSTAASATTTSSNRSGRMRELKPLWRLTGHRLSG